MLDGCVAWPEDLAAAYRQAGYWRGEPLSRLVRDFAARESERIALIGTDARVSYGALNQRADELAAGLYEFGLRAGDRVIVQLPNVPEFASTALALFRLGAVPIFALPAHRRSEIVHLCEHAGASAYVVPALYQGFDFRNLAREVRSLVPSLKRVFVAGEAQEFDDLRAVRARPLDLPEPAADDVAFFLLSGGTTGLPKLIPRTHDDYAYQLRATAEAVGFTSRSAYLACLPVAHNAALGCPGLLGALSVGGRVVLPETPSPDDVFPLIAAEAVTLTTLVPSLVKMWVDSADEFEPDLRGLLLQVGGARLEPEVARAVRQRLGCPLTHWFGMAEGLLSYTRLDDPPEVVDCTQGRPLCPADELRVVDEQGNDLPPNQVGELLGRGPYCIRGYYNEPRHNQIGFTEDGFLRTGDLVRFDALGNLIVEGRKKNVINRGGEKVCSEELEAHLLAHPHVREAAVVSVRDISLGEKTCACLVANAESVSLMSLHAFLRERGVADFKLPDRVELFERLPYTGLGKLDRKTLQLSIDRAAR
jgi:2,3-dihydroxybenzoate-AMP ligase